MRGALVSCAAALACAVEAGTSTYDVIIYGSTPSGIAAAVAASNNKAHSVLIVEPLVALGGMLSAGGLGLNDQQVHYTNNTAWPLITGLARTWCNLNGEHYIPGNASFCVQHPDNYVGEASARAMLAGAGVDMVLGCVPTSTSRSPSNPQIIDSITFDCTDGGGGASVTYYPRFVVIDASYDGDVMVADGRVSYATGRESREAYGETMAGIVLVQDPSEETFNKVANISATDDNGNLLPGISAGPLPAAGSADDRLMAFQHRVCVTTYGPNRVPFNASGAPPGYDRSTYTLLQRVVEAEVKKGYNPTPAWFGLSGPYNTAAGEGKTIVCCGAGAVMSDEPDLNKGWANATWAQRKVMMDNHRNWLWGMMFFLSTDPAVPDAVRKPFAEYGLCADEWTTAQPPHWPPQLYVRVSNRLVGDFVLTQGNTYSPRSKPEASVSMAMWELDSHITSRWAVPNPAYKPGNGLPQLIPFNEGFYRHGINVSIPINVSCGSPAGGCGPTDLWYDVPFQVVLPKASQVSNLMVTVALSASYVAYTSARIETMFMDLGAAAGVAARQVMQAGGPNTLPVQRVDIPTIQAVLQQQYGQRIMGPFYG